MQRCGRGSCCSDETLVSYIYTEEKSNKIVQSDLPPEFARTAPIPRDMNDVYVSELGPDFTWSVCSGGGVSFSMASTKSILDWNGSAPFLPLLVMNQGRRASDQQWRNIESNGTRDGLMEKTMDAMLFLRLNCTSTLLL